MEWKRTAGYLFAFFIVTAAMLMSQGCGGSSGGGSTGRLTVSLTDRNTDEFSSIVIAVKEVRVVPAGKEEAPDSDPALPVIARLGIPKVIDVKLLRFIQETLGNDVSVPAGTYNQVRLVLADTGNTVTVSGGGTFDLKTPSGQTSGLKIPGKFEVKPGEATAIMLDFDPFTAIVKKGNGNYSIKPTGIRIIELAKVLDSYGSIAGTAAAFRSWSSATFAVVPEGKSSAIAAGSFFSNYTSGQWQGDFSAFVPAGNYRLYLKSRGFEPYSSAVPVSAGYESWTGTALLNPSPPAP